MAASTESAMLTAVTARRCRRKNPEQLLAGWSACLLRAVKIVAGKRKVTLPAGTAIDAEVDCNAHRNVITLKRHLHIRVCRGSISNALKSLAV
jgi:organic hydroperoxide reductase OsmC/OhrA